MPQFRTALLSSWLALLPTSPQVHAATLVIANTRIIDVKRGTVGEPTDLVIEGNRIVGLQAPGSPRSKDQTIHDARGAFVVPGYWDMHAHVNSVEHAERWTLPLMLAAGVTGVRDMAGDCFTLGCSDSIEFMRSLQKRIAAGELAGPRIVAIGSAVIEGPREREPGAPDWSAPGDTKSVHTLLAELNKGGVDFIKPYDSMPRAVYLKMLRGARESGLPVSGHIPLSVSLQDALRAGVATIEHAKHPLIDCSSYSATFHDVFDQWAQGKSERIYSSWAAGGDNNLGGYYQPLLAGFDAQRCDRTIQAMRESSVHYVPTLITRRFEALADENDFLADARIDHVPASLRSDWRGDSSRYKARFAASPDDKRAYVEVYEQALRLTGRAHAAGVPILVGTDAPDSYCFPGSGLFDEMRELRKAGLSNGAILKAATLDAARFMHADADHGTVEVGKIADLLLLQANPLEDIDNAASLATVVFDGRMIDAPSIRALRERAHAYAKDAPPDKVGTH
jgi:imidazolonepropionase-like amidohydrolase